MMVRELPKRTSPLLDQHSMSLVAVIPSDSSAASAMTWAQRLKREFKIDIETCEQCGGAISQITRKADI